MDKSKTTSFVIEDVVGWKYEVWTLYLRQWIHIFLRLPKTRQCVLSAGSSSNLVKKLVSAIHITQRDKHPIQLPYAYGLVVPLS